jgi:uncharacterized protein YndB with AHSA1/START domain
MNDRTTSQDSMVIERTFDAPVRLIWQMWTVPEHFAAWYGPDGATTRVVEMDVRVGGRRHVGMEMAAPDGPRRMWFAGEFVEVEDNERLAYTEFVADENGDPVPAGTAGGHPNPTEVRIELAEVAGQTRMVLTHLGIASDSPGAAGWAMALDKLARHLAVD